MSNKDTYETPDVVSVYARLEGLQKPEATILRELEHRLKSMEMLDVGVGGGRTTRVFADLVHGYVGIDSSVKMIEACQARASAFPGKAAFRVCDVADMSVFQDQSFDFILFSYNGIDYLAHEGRLQAFREMRRVAKKGGVLCFSTHNLRSLFGPALPRWSTNPVKFLYRIARYVLLLCAESPFRRLANERYAIIDDGAHESRLTTYYVLPEEQLRQLADSGFCNVRIFGLETGKEVRGMSKIGRTRDRWLYFLCEVD